MHLKAAPALHQSGTRCPYHAVPACRDSTGCFHSSGVQSVNLGVDALYIGHRAYENCKQLINVDISNAVVDILHMHTFSHCAKLSSVSLPPSLQEIQAEAFIGCVALCGIDLPDALRYIAHRAFGECSQLSRLHYRRLVRTTWRRPYAAHNAFESCYRLATPWWLHYLPPNGSDWIVPPSHHT